MISRRALFAGAAGAVVAASAPGRAMAPRDIGWVPDSLMVRPCYGMDLACSPDGTMWVVRDGETVTFAGDDRQYQVWSCINAN